MSAFSQFPNNEPDHAYKSACRIIELIEIYLRRFKSAATPQAGDHTVTLMVRSPLSPAAAALATKAEDLAALEVGITRRERVCPGALGAQPKPARRA